jgi:hypothetical protein
VEAFTAAAEQAEADLRSSAEVMAAGDPEGRTVTHDNHPALVAHLKHARRSPNRYGVSVWKGHRESSRKIDLAVCLHRGPHVAPPVSEHDSDPQDGQASREGLVIRC